MYIDYYPHLGDCCNHSHIVVLALSAGAAGYTDCISAEGQDSPIKYPESEI